MALRIAPVVIAISLTVLAGLGAVYGIGGSGGNASESACADARAAIGRLKPFARGEVAALTVAPDSRPLPLLAFEDESGNRKTLAHWSGRTVLFNLWATWCVPCRKEMPALDALQGQLGSERFEVVAVNIDTRDAAKPKAWLRDAGINRLAYFADPTAKSFQDLKAAGKAFGMPTTVLIAPSGCEIASLAGPAEWASEDALKAVRAALGG